MSWYFSVIHDWKGLKQYCIEKYLVLYICILFWKICLCEKYLLFPGSTPSRFYANPLHFQPKKDGWRGYCSKKRTVEEGIAAKKRRQWWSCRSNYHRNQHLPVTPTNKQKVEITSSSWASDYGKGLCVHFHLFDKNTILWRAHVFLAWYSPWHCVLHLFLNLSAKNGN